MALKLDMVKAFDRVNWAHLEYMLHRFQFPANLIQILMKFVSTTSIAIKYNGGRTPYFKPSRGLRQKDPLSPLLFVLCMESLYAIINRDSIQGRWQHAPIKEGNIKITHLVFANDFALLKKGLNYFVKPLADK